MSDFLVFGPVDWWHGFAPIADRCAAGDALRANGTIAFSLFELIIIPPNAKRRSGRRRTLMRLGLVPFPARHDGGERLDCLPNVLMAGVQRSEAYPKNVRRPEIGSDVACDQRLADRIGGRVPEGHVAAALLLIPRSDELEGEPAASPLDKLDGEVAERLGFDVQNVKVDNYLAVVTLAATILWLR